MRILLSYVIGILIFKYVPNLYIPFSLICFLGIVTSSYLVFSRYRSKIGYLYSIPILVFFIALGIYNSYHSNPLNDVHHFIHTDKIKTFYGTLESIKETKSKQTNAIIKVTSIQDSTGAFIAANGKLQCYLKDTILDKSQLKSCIAIHSKFYPIQDNPNPNAFNYADVQRSKGVFFQAYADPSDWSSIRNPSKQTFSDYLQHSKNWCVRVFVKYLPNNHAQAIALAMILGDKSKMDASIYESFKNTGSIHVLAVSGLHVGIIAMIILFLLNQIQTSSPSIKLLKLIICISLIWLYAGLTGGAPAVLRATTMATFFFLGKFLYRNVNIYNILSFTALCILLVDPILLFNPGFQFSFLALLSIVYFCPILDTYFYISTPVLKQVCQFINVAIAAQILVLPLSLYYFHSFPIYFWLSGIIVIPGAVVILSLGLLMMVLDLCHLSILNESLIANLLTNVLDLFYYVVEYIQNLPFGLVENIWLDPYQVLFCFLTILLLSLFMHFRKAKYLITSLLGLVFYLGIHIHHTHQQLESINLTIYHQKDISNIDVFYENKLIHIASDTQNSTDIFTNTYHRMKHRIKESVNDLKTIPNKVIEVRESFFRIKNRVFLLAHNGDISKKMSDLPTDYVILMNDADVDIKTLRKQFDIRNVIVDGSNSNYYKKKQKKQCSYYRIPFYDTKTEAFELTF